MAIAYVLSWLNTYEGDDYEFYQKVCNECKKPYVCGKMIDLLDIKPKDKVGSRGKAINKCMQLIEWATRCMDGNEVECVYGILMKLLNNGCHDGYTFGRTIVNYVKELAHYVWKNR